MDDDDSSDGDTTNTYNTCFTIHLRLNMLFARSVWCTIANERHIVIICSAQKNGERIKANDKKTSDAIRASALTH